MNEACPNGTMSDPKKCPQCGATLPTGALDGLCPACLLQQGATKDSATQPAMPPFEPPPLDELARLFPHLDVLELIGKGGMGAVYKARQPSLDRFVALKILPPETVAGHGFGERFNREARALARLGHPNIVAVYDFGQVGGLHYFLMEFVDGVNLRQLQRAGRLSPREALQIIPQICDALQYAHDEGVVHRDIKPENILVDRKGRVKIADFGLAKILGRDPADLRLTGEGQVMGTPHYMAPEQIEHPLDVDHRADIYSLGVVFYEMLTGELPLGRFAPPSRKVQVDVRLDEVVLHALEKEPEHRYQHASEVKTDVQSIAMPGPGTPRQRFTKLPIARAVAWGLLVGLLTLVGSMTFTLLQPDEYVGTARVTVERPVSERIGTPSQSDRHWLDRELDFVRSDLVLSRVVDRLNLKATWSGRNEMRRALKPSEIAMELMRRTEVRRVLHTDVLEINVFSRNNREAADIANAIADTYRSLNKARKVEIIDPAEPGFRPVRPNRVSNLAGSIALGLLFGSITTCGILFLAKRRSRTENAKEIFPETGVPLFPDSFELTFRSPRALKIARIGWVLGCLAALGFLPIPIPGWKGMFGFSGFFGLIGVAALIETVHRRRIAHGRRGAENANEPEVTAHGTRVVQGADAGGRRREPWLLWALGTAGIVLFMVPVGLMVLYLFNSRNIDSRDTPISFSPAAEVWSPSLAPGEKPNPSKILEEASALAAKGQYEEALQRHLWYHNHALEYNAAQTGVRLSFALSAWVELGRKYPKARQALVEIRDRKTRDLAEGRGSFDLFHDVVSINGYLQDEDATFALFKTVQEKDPALAKRCFIVAEDLLVKKGEYALCLSFIPDPEAKFMRIRQSWETDQAISRNNPTLNRPDFRKGAEDRFVTKTCHLIEILVGTGHKAEAEKIREQALALLDDPRLKSATSDAEESVGRMRGQSRTESTGAPRPPLAVSISSDGLLRLGPEARLVSIDALREEFQTQARADTNLALAITATKDAPLQQIMRLIDLAKEMGIRSISTLTQPVVTDAETKVRK